MFTRRTIQNTIFRFIFVFVILFVFSLNTNVTQAQCVSSNTHYCLLAPLGTASSVDTTVGVGAYFNTLIHVFIGLLTVLAVVMIIVGGIQYMIGSSGGEKAGGKNRIENALYGLVLALASYLILNTINPKLVNLQLGVPGASLTASNPLDPGTAPITTAGGGTYNAQCNTQYPSGYLSAQFTVDATAQPGSLPLATGMPWPSDTDPTTGSMIDVDTTNATHKLNYPADTAVFFQGWQGKIIYLLGDTSRTQISASVDLGGGRADLGISVPSACTSVGTFGDSGCVSTYGYSSATIAKIRALDLKCKDGAGNPTGCSLSISKGTECWRDKTHSPSSTAVNFLKSAALKTYVTSLTKTCNEHWNNGATGGFCANGADASGGQGNWEYAGDGYDFIDEGDSFHMM